MDHRRHRIDRSRCSTPSKFVLHRRCHSRPVQVYTRSIRCRIGRSAETSLDCRVFRCALRTNVPNRRCSVCRTSPVIAQVGRAYVCSEVGAQVSSRTLRITAVAASDAPLKKRPARDSGACDSYLAGLVTYPISFRSFAIILRVASGFSDSTISVVNGRCW